MWRPPDFVKIEFNFNSWLVSDIQNLCDSNVVSTCGEPQSSIIYHQPQSLGVRESKAKIDKLEKEVFVLKLQLTHYRNGRPTQVDEKRLISLQVSVWPNAMPKRN